MGAECSITFREYKHEEDRCYPKESLSGEFQWDKDTRSLTVDLRYRKADLTGPLALLIFAAADDLVRIKMRLLADISELARGRHRPPRVNVAIPSLSVLDGENCSYFARSSDSHRCAPARPQRLPRPRANIAAHRLSDSRSEGQLVG
jgi:hypothetical protein